MFEDSRVESRVGHVSSSKRWTTVASFSLQVAIAGVVIALPLFHPEVLPLRIEASRVLIPLMPKPPVPVRVQEVSASSTNTPALSSTRPLLVPVISSSGNPTVGEPPPAPVGPGMGGDGVPDGFVNGTGHEPVVTPASPTPAARLNVSTGVLQGMLIAPIRPVYPTIAKSAHVEGAVVVEAIISKTGTVESLHVVSGPPMLQNAALDAIRAARYQPYRLNGEPTEVETRITVNFRIGS
jgi:periplasmic protein TonB